MMAVVIAVLFGSCLAKTNLYVAIIDVDNHGFVCRETMSLESYADLMSKGDESFIQETYPNATFILIHVDPKTGVLTPTDPKAQLKLFKGEDHVHDWYRSEVNLKNILKKSGKLFLSACDVLLLISCWVGGEVLVPGSLVIYEQSSIGALWLKEQLEQIFAVVAVAA